jgi:indolepyruvate ferredoxin oxidoreductase
MYDGDFSMRITGIGGTGVVTVAQIIATAAVIDGKAVRSLDQTGLAQKGGAVVSDLKITATPTETAPKVSSGACDLYLVCDSLVGTDPANLKAASPDRTVAVLSTTAVPTGRMVVDTGIEFPAPGAIRGALDAAVARTVSLDAGHLATELFASEQYANMILVGAAFQLGRLPISETALEEAVTLNGASVATNLQAFRRGRQAVADPDALQQTIHGTASADVPTDLTTLVTRRTAELLSYQDEAYAKEYAEFVEKTRAAEDAATPGATDLTEAVATNLYKLMAYKDEYEVARLILDETFDAKIRNEFGQDATYKVRLHPPILRTMGLKKKIALGHHWRPLFRLLHTMRRLRGTRLDVFGYHPVRRLERQLITEYRHEIEQLLPHLTPHTAATAAKLAALPDMIRGYEQIKIANVRDYRTELARLRDELTTYHPATT